MDRCLVTKPTLLVEFEHNCIGEEEVVWKMCSGPVDFLVRLNAFGKFLRCLKSQCMCPDNVSLELSMKVDADLSGLLVVVGEDSLVVAGVLMVPGGCLVAEYLSVYSILISITADWL